ncbi:MAG: class I SAM-dependent methyltransferase [Natronohydrobacter sp.]|nr:class I SAM-dependent methyltransferase [Natronohydrobacter sp.]
MKAKPLAGWQRHDILQLLGPREGLTGVELGVAAGGFSARMVQSGRFQTFFGVDMYADTHDVSQYKEALRNVGLFAPYKLLRMTFAEALELFEDESLDFVYIDGYAHTGQEGGQTIWDWARKVRVGGLIAGDDYHPDWPLVQQAVEAFAAETGFELLATTEVDRGSRYDDYPSWVMVKSAPVAGAPPAALLAKGRSEAARVAAKRRLGKRLGDVLRRLIGDARYQRMREWNRARKQRRKG